MRINFYKYQGTGNDFIIIDNRENKLPLLNEDIVSSICNRKYGIGSDGLMLLNSHTNYDFEMKYYNADGFEGSMCGNGGRCLVKFAYNMGIRKKHYRFIASDGEHEAEIEPGGWVRLKMKDVKSVEEINGDMITDTGSPHFIRPVEDLQHFNVPEEGRKIRYSEHFSKKGINVNFVEQLNDDEIFVRTYERGVEDETLSCGTGVTAAALAFFHNEHGFNAVKIRTRGGNLTVEFDRDPGHGYNNIWLAGPAEEVFEGRINILSNSL